MTQLERMARCRYRPPVKGKAVDAHILKILYNGKSKKKECPCGTQRCYGEKYCK